MTQEQMITHLVAVLRSPAASEWVSAAIYDEDTETVEIAVHTGETFGLLIEALS